MVTTRISSRDRSRAIGTVIPTDRHTWMPSTQPGQSGPQKAATDAGIYDDAALLTDRFRLGDPLGGKPEAR